MWKVHTTRNGSRGHKVLWSI